MGIPRLSASPNIPGRIQGTITRHPEALNSDTRTMLVEVDLPNENEVLYPGCTPP